MLISSFCGRLGIEADCVSFVGDKRWLFDGSWAFSIDGRRFGNFPGENTMLGDGFTFLKQVSLERLPVFESVETAEDIAAAFQFYFYGFGQEAQLPDSLRKLGEKIFMMCIDSSFDEAFDWCRSIRAYPHILAYRSGRAVYVCGYLTRDGYVLPSTAHQTCVSNDDFISLCRETCTKIERYWHMISESSSSQRHNGHTT